jgi:Uma2 family endonuclease
MVEATRTMSAEELELLPSGYGNRYELVRGELRTMTPTGLIHGLVTMRAASLLVAFVRSHQLGAVLAAETGYLLSRQPDHVRAADVAFIARGRLSRSDIHRPGYAPIAPDLVVEVISPSDTWSSVTEKALDWLAHGVKVVWLLDPDTRTAQIWRSGGEVDRRSGDAEIDAEPVLPGFRCATSEMFPDLEADLT